MDACVRLNDYRPEAKPYIVEAFDKDGSRRGVERVLADMPSDHR
jgi:hypothetical protein